MYLVALKKIATENVEVMWVNCCPYPVKCIIYKLDIFLIQIFILLKKNLVIICV